MKDELVAVVIAVLLTGLFVYNSYAMEAGTKQIIALIDELESPEDANSKNFKKIHSLWEKEKQILLIILSHENLSDVDECMEMAEECIKAKRGDVALYMLKKAGYYLADLKQREKISLDNIF